MDSKLIPFVILGMDYCALLNIFIIKNDITTLKNVACIVNSTDQRFKISTGLSYKIEQKAGPQLRKTFTELKYCGLGEPRLTSGFDLCNNIIHVVGPHWHGGIFGERDYLYNCYKKSLLMASNNQIESIAYPAISTGWKKYPKELAAEVAFRTVISHQKSPRRLKKVIFCLNDDENFHVYQSMKSIIEAELKKWFTPSNLVQFSGAPISL